MHSRKTSALRMDRRVPARMRARRYRNEPGPHSRDRGRALGGRDRRPPQDTHGLFLLVVARQRRPGCLGPATGDFADGTHRCDLILDIAGTPVSSRQAW
jgi:hypothetical protein